jgi:hypothetical protein
MRVPFLKETTTASPDHRTSLMALSWTRQSLYPLVLTTTAL